MLAISFLLSFTIVFTVCIPNCAHAAPVVSETFDPKCEYYYGSITGPDKCWCAKPLPGEKVGGGENFTTVAKKLCREWFRPIALRGNK